MRANTIITAGALGSLLLAQGCVATRDWVKEQMDPVSNRVSQSESRLTQSGESDRHNGQPDRGR